MSCSNACLSLNFKLNSWSLFNKVFNSRKEIETFCENYFIERKKNTKEIIEGIVLKTEDCMFSAKYMNNEYDSKK